MTGWKTDKETKEFSDKIIAELKANKHLLPDAWYWISLEMNFEFELKEKDIHSLKVENPKYIEWLKSEPDILNRQISQLKELIELYKGHIRSYEKDLEELTR